MRLKSTPTRGRNQESHLASKTSGGAYSAVCSSSEGPALPYNCSTECLSRADPKSIRRRCKTPTAKSFLVSCGPVGWRGPCSDDDSQPPLSVLCNSRFSGFTSLQEQAALHKLSRETLQETACIVCASLLKFKTTSRGLQGGQTTTRGSYCHKGVT